MSSSSSPAAAPAASVVPLPGQETAVDVMNRSCPQENLAYKQCTDGFFSIDITTRLTTPVMHKKQCKEEFEKYKKCLSDEMLGWVEKQRVKYAAAAATPASSSSSGSSS